MQITPDQCRMARAAVRMSIAELGEAADVRPMTVSSFERGAGVHASTIAKLQAALEAAGVEFIPAGEASGDGGPGVRLRGVSNA